VETFRILVIEDQLQLAEDVKREIADSFESESDPDLIIDIETDFERGYSSVRSGAYDMVVLDVRRDETEESAADIDAGRRAFAQIKNARFVPVIFWTALPDEVADSVYPPLITVTKKTSMQDVPLRIRDAIDSGAVSAMKSVGDSVEDVIRRHMWEEVAPNWSEYRDDTFDSISQVLITRIARMLEGQNAEKFTSHPHHRYVYPPVAAMRGPGDIVRKNADDSAEWYVVLTPACDFVPRKDGTPNAEFVVIARARSLDVFEKYQKWTTKPHDDVKWDSLRQSVLMATHTRHSYLPAFRSIPDLVIDLQEVASIKFEELSNFDAVASLAPPFAEALISQYSHYVGRIGVPDLNSDAVRDRLSAGL
jgi:CheY-like chemotaxis protein